MKNFNFIPETATDITINEYGNYEYTTHAGGTTYWEYDPETGMTRHCGEGKGCFWTDWEEQEVRKMKVNDFNKEIKNLIKINHKVKNCIEKHEKGLMTFKDTIKLLVEILEEEVQNDKA